MDQLPDVFIGDFRIGDQSPPMIIAEMSGNHNQSLERAISIVDAAADAGADAIKLQTYTADTMTLNVDHDDFVIKEADSPWHGRRLHDLYGEAHTPWSWHQAIFDHAKQRGIIALSSPFDETAVDFLEKLQAPAYKIASFEMNHLPLIRRVAQTGRPIILSTGMARLSEIELAVETARHAGATELILLKCTSTYPATPDTSHLRTMNHIRQAFGVHVGLSDHTLGVGVSVAAVALGAVLIEKHFTLDRDDGGVDSAFSLEPDELQSLVQETKQAKAALGSIEYGPTGKQSSSLVFRRSIYFVHALSAGDEITPEDIRIIRPGFGLAPKHFDELIGRRVRSNVAIGDPVTWQRLQ